MRPHHVLVLTLLGAALTPAPASAQGVAETPEQVAERYIHALKARQWDSMALLMHPAALRQLRDVLTPLFEAPSLGEARDELLGVHSIGEAQALSDTAVFIAFMSRAMSSQTQLMDLMGRAQIQVLGHLAEGPDTVHVLYRISIEDTTVVVSKMDVFSELRWGDSWRGLLEADLRMLGAMLRRQARS